MFRVAVPYERFSRSLSPKRMLALQRISTHFACTVVASAIRFVVGVFVVSAVEIVVVGFAEVAVVSSAPAVAATVVVAALAVSDASAAVVATAMTAAAVVSPSSIPPPFAHRRCLRQGDSPPPYPRLSSSARHSGVRKTTVPLSFSPRLPSPPLNAPSLLPKAFAPCG